MYNYQMHQTMEYLYNPEKFPQAPNHHIDKITPSNR